MYVSHCVARLSNGSAAAALGTYFGQGRPIAAGAPRVRRAARCPGTAGGTARGRTPGQLSPADQSNAGERLRQRRGAHARARQKSKDSTVFRAAHATLHNPGPAGVATMSAGRQGATSTPPSGALGRSDRARSIVLSKRAKRPDTSDQIRRAEPAGESKT